jgi:peptide/nickel transport system ATP-binding protein
VPSATRPPSGCPFRTRCWKATDICATEMPAPETSAAGSGLVHEFRCYHPVPAGTGDAELVQLARSATRTTTPDGSSDNGSSQPNVEETA